MALDGSSPPPSKALNLTLNKRQNLKESEDKGFSLAEALDSCLEGS